MNKKNIIDWNLIDKKDFFEINKNIPKNDSCIISGTENNIGFTENNTKSGSTGYMNWGGFKDSFENGTKNKIKDNKKDNIKDSIENSIRDSIEDSIEENTDNWNNDGTRNSTKSFKNNTENSVKCCVENNICDDTNITEKQNMENSIKNTSQIDKIKKNVMERDMTSVEKITSEEDTDNYTECVYKNYTRNNHTKHRKKHLNCHKEKIIHKAFEFAIFAFVFYYLTQDILI